MKKKITILGLKRDVSSKTRAIVRLANSLVELYKVEMLFLDEDDNCLEIDSKIKIIIKNVSLFESRKFFTQFFKDSDVIISTDEYYNKFIAKNAECKTIFWTHQKVSSKCDDKYLCKFDFIVVSNKSLQQGYLSYNKNVLAINDAILLPPENEVASGENLIFVGDLTREKNIEILIGIFERVLQEYKTNLIIVGIGEERKKLEKDLKSKGITSVYFKGFLSNEELKKEFFGSALYVTCEQCESFNLSMLEAMSYGLPVVAFSSSLGDEQFIVDDVNGYLIKNDDVDEMVVRILDILNDKKKCESLSACAKETSWEYDISSIKKEWLKIL